MRFEMIKLFRQVHVKGAFLVVIFLSIFFGIAGAGGYSSLADADSSTYLKGKAAFENERRKYTSVSGDITIEKLNEALRYIQSCTDEWSAIAKGYEGYPGLLYLLENAYAVPDGHFTLFEIQDADDLYERMETQIRTRMDDRGLRFSEHEMKDILTWAAKIQKPYRNEMAQPWSRFYTSFQFVLLLNILTVMIYASGLYSYEKTCRMDLVIGILDSHRLRRIVIGKSKALVCLAGGQYFVSIAAVSMVFFGISGPIAWKSQIQTLYFTSILPLSYKELFLLTLGTGLIVCLAAAFFAAAANAGFSRTMPAMILGVTVTFMPLVLRNFTMLPNGLMKLIQVLPVNAALVENNVNSLYLYPSPGIGIPAFYAVPAAGALLWAAGMCCSVQMAGKYLCRD